MRLRQAWVAATAISLASASVSADPETQPGAAARRPAPTHVYGRARQVWIWSEPSTKSQRLGFFRAGSAVRLRSAASAKGPGCRGGFYAVEPHGFVCLDDDSTLDRNHRYVRAMRLAAPKDSAMPFRYAISNGAPMYQRLPTPSEWEKAERDFGEAGSFKEYPWNEKHERLAEVRAQRADAPLPFFLENGGSVRSVSEETLVRRKILLGSMLAYTRVFEHAGRQWLLASDGTVVPADRVRPYRRSRFAGVELTGTRRLPLGWTARKPSVQYVRGSDGDFVALEETWAPRTAIGLDATDTARPVRSDSFYATTARRGKTQLWVHEDDVTVITASNRTPSGVGDTDKWLVVGVRSGTLVAYEGSRPVFATLIAPGAGGISRPDKDPVQASTTPRGSYRIQYKYYTQTMSPQKDKPEDERTYWISEVPYAQYFRIPFALHTAYWHEDFGEWMSGGCVNLSPEDGRWLFGWTTPTLPKGWDGVWAGGDSGRGTRVIVER